MLSIIFHNNWNKAINTFNNCKKSTYNSRIGVYKSACPLGSVVTSWNTMLSWITCQDHNNINSNNNNNNNNNNI